MHRLDNHVRIDVYTFLPLPPIRMLGTGSADEAQSRTRQDSEQLKN